MNKLTFKKVLTLVFLVGVSIHLLGQINLKKEIQEGNDPLREEYNPPTNFQATATHFPSWYSVKLSWNLPEGDHSSLSVWDKSTIITHPGKGHEGADVSAMMDGATGIGHIGTKERYYSLADQFTLTKSMELDSVHFFTMQPLTPVPNPAPNAKEVFIRIWDKAPNTEGAEVIWGDFATNLKTYAVFSNIYRAPVDNLEAHTGWGGDNGYPIIQITAKLGAALTAGTYWIEVTASPNTTIQPSHSNILFCPITIAGQKDTGNALQCFNGTWAETVDPGNGGKAGIAMEIFGKSAGKYNIYRDGVKLNDEPLSDFTYADIVPEAGTYVYSITTVYPSGDESAPVTSTVTIETDPCGDSIVVSDVYAQGFENGMPNCWREDMDENEVNWEIAFYNESSPATAYHGTRKALYRGEEGAVTKLVTTKFDISELENPNLSFWYTQKANEDKQDELRVYYRNEEADNWTLLAEYTEDIADWTKIDIALPDPTTTYWLAFEGTGNGGYGVMIDNILIHESNGISCPSLSNMTYTTNTPVEEWYNVHLGWDLPENAIDGDNTHLWDNGPIITHYGEGYEGADVSAVENNSIYGANITNVDGYCVADDFTLDRPTHISQMVFYCYEHFQSGDPEDISRFNVSILDASPMEDGSTIWGGFQNSVLNREETKFSGIYRTHVDALESPSRPLIQVVTDIDFVLPAGTYWILVSADSKIDPSKGGAVFMPPVTVLGEPNTGNAIQKRKGGIWTEWDMEKGQAAIPFEILGKEIYTSFDVYRDGDKINDAPVVVNYYTDSTPGEGSYNYCVKTVWETGCVSNDVCVQVEMTVDPCESAITTFPYLEDFESADLGPLVLDCWRQIFVDGGSFGTERLWDVAPASSNKPNTAISGNQKAMLADVGGSKTKLVTPMFDLTSLARPTLKFWHAQGDWDGKQNELRVYYKNAKDAEWVMIAEYTESIPDWVEETIKLPEPSESYWIAFESYADLGRYLMLDDIRVENVNVSTIVADVQGGNGSISPSGVVEVEKGKDQTFTFIPNDGYAVDYVLIDDNNKGAMDSYTFDNITRDHTITVVFKQSVGIAEVENTQFAVYPNPTAGKVFVKSTTGSNIKNIQVYGLMGDLLYQLNDVNKSEAEVDLTSYAEGIYFIQVDQKTIKVIKR